MRTLCVAAILASSALSAPAFAKDDFWYVSLQGGPSLFENQNHRVVTDGVPGATAAVTTNSKTGFNVAGELGYDFGLFRSGFELGYQRAGLGDVNNIVGIPAVGVGGVNNLTTGNANVLSFMLNGLFDFGNSDSWTGSLGGGVGVAQYKASKFSTGTLAPFLDDSDTGFAWQALASIRKAISDNVDLNLGYKYFNIPKINTVALGGAAPLRTKLATHNLMLGFTYNFGGEVAPPPAPPPPPPPPAPAAVVEAAPPPPPPPPVAAPGPFIIFFDWDKSVITPEADKILTDAADAYKSTGQVAIQLSGHADKSGTDSYNEALSGRRSSAAIKRLVALGVPESAISSSSFGEGKPMVETADGVREPQNRRVEIMFPPK
jgi:OmpA-OmpF porin, OOP family